MEVYTIQFFFVIPCVISTFRKTLVHIILHITFYNFFVDSSWLPVPLLITWFYFSLNMDK